MKHLINYNFTISGFWKVDSSMKLNYKINNVNISYRDMLVHGNCQDSMNNIPQLDGNTSLLENISSIAEPCMVTYAIRSADKHGIKLSQGRPNAASGNCLFESILYNINDRHEYSYYEKINISVQEARVLWITQLQSIIDENYPFLIPDYLQDI